MAESNGGWGSLESTEAQNLWDTFEPLPEPGENAALDSFLERKQLTAAALVRTGTRLSSPTVLAFAYPDGIKYRDLVTDRRWAAIGTEWRRLKIVPASEGESTTVAVAEGETDAARLTMLRPDFDVAILPAGARRWSDTWTQQLSGYARVLVALDNDAAGNNGAARIGEALAQAVRWAPPEGKDWCETSEDEVPEIPEPAPVEIYGGLRRTRLGDAIAQGLTPPEALVEGILHSVGLHWRYGRPGGGKTTLALYCAEQAMLQGRSVIWCDFEGGDYVTALRLQDMEIPHRLAEAGRDIDEQFFYFGWPDRVERALPEAVADVAPDGPRPLVVLDSASKALGLSGRDENSNSEVTTWNAQIVRATKQLELPVIVIDHVAKGTNTGPRGAGAKSADADVVWHVETPTDHRWDRTRGGMIVARLADKGDRFGVFSHERWFDVGDGAGTLTVTARDEGPVEAGAEEVPAI